MSSRAIVVVALFLGFALCAVGWGGFAEDKPRDIADRAKNARARLEAAKNAYEGGWKHYLAEPESAPSPTEHSHNWSVRWLQAERDLARNKAEHIAALEAHLKRMQTRKDMLVSRFREGTSAMYQIHGAEYFRLEAEEWLAAEKASEK